MSHINFLSGHWLDLVSQIQGADNELKKPKKYVFLYVCANWSASCRKMETEALSDKLVVAFYNANFTCIRIYMGNHPDTDTPQKLKDALNVEVETYPLMLYLDHQGRVIHQVAGDLSPKDLINEGKSALSFKFNWI